MSNFNGNCHNCGQLRIVPWWHEGRAATVAYTGSDTPTPDVYQSKCLGRSIRGRLLGWTQDDSYADPWAPNWCPGWVEATP